MASNIYVVQVQWGDCDPAGIVYYPNYYRWMDEAGHQLFASAGLGWDVLRQRYDAPGLPLISTHAEFRAPCYFRDRLEIEAQVTRWGDRSLTLGYSFRKDGELAAEGWEKRVWSQGDPRRMGRIVSAPIPDEVKAALGGA